MKAGAPLQISPGARLTALKDMLIKYNFQDKKFLYDERDIQHQILEYKLVRNRWGYNNNSIILKTINCYDYCWKTFNTMNDTILFKNKLDKVFWRRNN